MLKKIFLVLFLAASIACQAGPSVVRDVPGSANIKPDEAQSLIARRMLEVLEAYHYKKVKVGDSLSSATFDNYLKALDPGRNYLLASDVKDFEQYRNTLDDNLRKGDLSAMFYMFNVYQKRYDERIKYALAQLNSKFSYTGNDTYTYNRENMPWLASTADADKLWRSRVAYELLNLKLTGTDAAKNIQTIKTRYDNLLSQSAKVNNQDVFQLAMDAFTSTIDPHTNYFNPVNAERFNEDMARNYEGIGARLQLENEVVKIAEIIAGGPAFKAKTLQANDRIVAVAQGKTGEFEDVIGWRLDNVVAKIKGPKNTLVRLKVIPAGEEMSAKPKIVELVRDRVVLQDQSAKKSIKTVKSGDKTYRIGVIEIPAFYLDFNAYRRGDPDYKSTTRDVKLILDSLKQEKVDGVVVDLRSNGGGSLIEAIELTGLFIKQGPVVQVRERDGKVEVDNDEDALLAYDGPLGVMVDRFSASASEIFAGAIQDYGRGIVVGTQSYGKGTVQSGIDMSRLLSPSEKTLFSSSTGAAPRFGQINLTISKFYRINGTTTQHTGVIPDIQFPMIFPADKYGESSEKAALPADVIKPSNYTAIGDLSSINKELEELHQKRMQASAEYKYLLEDIEQFKKRESETTVTLNEEQLKKERDEQEARSLARTNQRRAAKGLPALKKGEVKSADAIDYIEDESLNVMADFIRLNQTNRFSLKF